MIVSIRLSPLDGRTRFKTLGNRVMVWAKGKVLRSGQYVIECVLGEGGFGVTYLAFSEDSTPVVIKVLKEEFIEQSSSIDKCKRDFQAEAIRLKRFSHPNIIKINTFFYDDSGRPCLVLEYVDGQDLATYLSQNGYLDENVALQYIRQLGSALYLMHEGGILHRDIKPQNILLRNNTAEVVLIDFGIAREFTPDITQSHTQLVSDYYSPLEQYSYKAKRGAYTDIYSLSATLYTLLTNSLPTPATVRTIGEEFPSPKSLNPAISDRVNNAILLGMELNPKHRPQSVQEWFRAIGLELTVDGTTSDGAPIDERLQTVVVSPGRGFRETERERSDRVERQDHAVDTVHAESNFPLDDQTSASLPLISLSKTVQKSESFLAQLRKYLFMPTLGYLGIGISLFFVTTEGVDALKRNLENQQAIEKLQDLEELMTTGNYDECLVQTSQVLPESHIYQDATESFNQCSKRILEQAQSKYDEGKIVEGMAIATKVPEHSTHYQGAQYFIENSYKNIVNQARVLYAEKGELDQAINMLKAITILPFQGKAEEQINDWQTEWNKNQQLYQESKRELDAKNWESVKLKAGSVTTDYWAIKTQQLIEQANIEKGKEEQKEKEKRLALPPTCDQAKAILKHNLHVRWNLSVINSWDENMSDQSSDHPGHSPVPDFDYPRGRHMAYVFVIAGPKAAERMKNRPPEPFRTKREPEIANFFSYPQSPSEITTIIAACPSIGVATFLGEYETWHVSYVVRGDGRVEPLAD